MSTLLVTVNYFSSHIVGDYLRALDQHVFEGLTCVIVDNSCDETESQMLQDAVAARRWVVVMPAPENLGYMGGLRFALQTFDPIAFDWVILSNLDVTYDEGFVRGLEELHEPDVGIVGPHLIDVSSGIALNPYMRVPPTIGQMNRLELVFRWLPIAKLYVFGSGLAKRLKGLLRSVRSRESRAVAPTGGPVYAVHGAVFAISREFFLRGGDVLYAGFLFGEEIAMAEKCRDLDLQVRYEPNLVVRHAAHATTGLWRPDPLLAWQRDSLHACRHLMAQVDARIQRRGRPNRWYAS